MHIDNAPLKTLTDAAEAAKKALGLKRTPVVFRDGDLAKRCAARGRAETVMLGDGAFWIVCLADAERLNNAGYEYAA